MKCILLDNVSSDESAHAAGRDRANTLLYNQMNVIQLRKKACCYKCEDYDPDCEECSQRLSNLIVSMF